VTVQEQIQSEELPDSVFACAAIIQKNIGTIERMLKKLLTERSGTEMMPVAYLPASLDHSF
jgi:hypothetical protein